MTISTDPSVKHVSSILKAEGAPLSLKCVSTCSDATCIIYSLRDIPVNVSGRSPSHS